MEDKEKYVLRYLSKSGTITAAGTDEVRHNRPSWNCEIVGVSIIVVDSATSRTALAAGVSVNSIKMGSETLFDGDAVDHSLFKQDGGMFLKQNEPIMWAKEKDIVFNLTNNAAANQIVQTVFQVRVKWSDYSNQ